MKRTIVTLSALALVAGMSACGASEPTAPEAKTSVVEKPGTDPAPSATPGPDAFVTWARSQHFGTKAMNTASYDALLGVGNGLCGMLSSSQSFGSTVSEITKDQKASAVTSQEVEAFVRASVVNLCPQNKVYVP